MWIFRNDSMLSVVEDRGNKERLLVRARKQGDIEAVFPRAKTFSKKGSDYLYRAWIGRKEVADAIYESVMNINYDNFKDSINKCDYDRKRAYTGVWCEMLDFQMGDEDEDLQGSYYRSVFGKIQ